VLSYFREVLADVRLPLTLYNIPQLVKRPLDEATIRELASDPRLVGIKHSSDDLQMLLRFKQIDNGRLIVWNGRDAQYIGSLAMGADGAIGSSYQLIGDVFIAISAAFRTGDNQRALRLQQEINAVHARLLEYGPAASVKRCLRLLGIEAGECRLPFQPLPRSADDFFRKTLDLADCVRESFNLPLAKRNVICESVAG
jgi:N-acetylneuraminate lyase